MLLYAAILVAVSFGCIGTSCTSVLIFGSSRILTHLLTY
jgi:hypothetical protein